MRIMCFQFVSTIRNRIFRNTFLHINLTCISKILIIIVVSKDSFFWSTCWNFVIDWVIFNILIPRFLRCLRILSLSWIWIFLSWGLKFFPSSWKKVIRMLLLIQFWIFSVSFNLILIFLFWWRLWIAFKIFIISSPILRFSISLTVPILFVFVMTFWILIFAVEILLFWLFGYVSVRLIRFLHFTLIRFFSIFSTFTCFISEFSTSRVFLRTFNSLSFELLKSPFKMIVFFFFNF